MRGYNGTRAFEKGRQAGPRERAGADLENCIEDETDRRFGGCLGASEKAVENIGRIETKARQFLEKASRGAAQKIKRAMKF